MDVSIYTNRESIAAMGLLLTAIASAILPRIKHGQWQITLAEILLLLELLLSFGWFTYTRSRPSGMALMASSSGLFITAMIRQSGKRPTLDLPGLVVAITMGVGLLSVSPWGLVFLLCSAFLMVRIAR